MKNNQSLQEKQEENNLLDEEKCKKINSLMDEKEILLDKFNEQEKKMKVLAE